MRTWDIWSARPKPFNSRISQSIPCQISHENLTLKFLALRIGKKNNQKKQTPQALIKPERMYLNPGNISGFDQMFLHL